MEWSYKEKEKGDRWYLKEERETGVTGKTGYGNRLGELRAPLLPGRRFAWIQLSCDTRRQNTARIYRVVSFNLANFSDALNYRLIICNLGRFTVFSFGKVRMMYVRRRFRWRIFFFLYIFFNVS